MKYCSEKPFNCNFQIYLSKFKMYEIVTLALLVGSGIIVIGVLVSYLLDRTGLPDMLLFIILGILLGPVFRVFDPASIEGFVFSVTALILFTSLVFGLPLLYGLLFGRICGGSSSI